MAEAIIHPFDSLVEVYSKNPYADISQKRARRVVDFVESIGFKPKNVLDVGCGGGVGTEVFMQAGYNVKAIDLSHKSLIWAMHGNKDNSSYTQQDMRLLGFRNGCFDLITSIFDSLNYVTEKELDDIFFRSFQCLRSEGLIVLDFLTPMAFSDITIRPDSIYIGDKFYFLSTAIPEFPNKVKLLFTAFIENSDNNSYRKITETHMLQPFSVEKITSALIKNGFTLLKELDGEDDKPAVSDSWHSFVVAKKSSI